MESKTLCIIARKRTRLQTGIKIAIHKISLRLHIYFFREPMIKT